MIVTVMALTRQEHDLAESDGRARGAIRSYEPLNDAPIKHLRRHGRGIDELVPAACHHFAPIAIALKRRIFSTSAISAGRRSMLDAPKKPTTPRVCAST